MSTKVKSPDNLPNKPGVYIMRDSTDTIIYIGKAKNLVKKLGVSQEFGAREVDRVIRNDLKPLFVDEILFGKLKNGGKIRISAAKGDFVVNYAGLQTK